MADYKLPDGREITFDLSEMTYGQWLGMFDAKESDERSDETLARVAGLEMDDLKAISYPEYKRLLAVFFKRCRDPISDPND